MDIPNGVIFFLAIFVFVIFACIMGPKLLDANEDERIVDQTDPRIPNTNHPVPFGTWRIKPLYPYFYVQRYMPNKTRNQEDFTWDHWETVVGSDNSYLSRKFNTEEAAEKFIDARLIRQRDNEIRRKKEEENRKAFQEAFQPRVIPPFRFVKPDEGQNV